jgi:hypothetical protein
MPRLMSDPPCATHPACASCRASSAPRASRCAPLRQRQRAFIRRHRVDEHMLQPLFCAFQMYVAKVDLVLHMLQWLCTCVATICFKCFSYFKRMLQVFHLNVTYVAVVIHVCYKYVFQMFQLFYVDVACFSSECCICCSGYTRMLQMYILNVSPISNVCCKCFYLDVAYVAVVIHIYCKRMF